MLSKITMISFEELKFVTPRLALYTALVYATIRVAGVVTDQASRLMGLDPHSRS
jgi:hypothetical protein